MKSYNWKKFIFLDDVFDRDVYEKFIQEFKDLIKCSKCGVDIDKAYCETCERIIGDKND